MSAFPILSLLQSRDGDYSLEQEGGLTKRELFAAMFLQASISICNNEFMMNAIRGAAKRNGQEMDDYLASHSVKTADRLIAELEKTND